MADVVRKCIFCSQEVTEQSPGKTFMGPETPDGYIHRAQAENGVPNCGRRILTEEQTFTEQAITSRDDTDF